MKFILVILASATASFVISLIGAVRDYVPQNERLADTYYFSIGESLIWTFFMTAPYFIGLGVAVYSCYLLLKKWTRFRKIVNGLLSIIVVGVLATALVFTTNKTEETNNIYLIPEGQEGEFYVFYNVEGAPKLKTEGDYDVHTINEDGYFVTSKSDLDYGTITDKYYYVDELGNRTPINETCVSPDGISGFSTSTEGNKNVDLVYTAIEITKTNCSDEFRNSNHEYSNENNVMREVLEKFYGIDTY